MISALLGLLLWVAWAGPPADLSGTWRLDEARSESMDAILQARGVGWIERQAMSWMSMTWHITQSDAALVVEVESTGYHRVDTYPSDGQTRSLQSEREGTVQQRCFWQGEVFVVESRVTLPDGAPATWTVRRSLGEAGAVLYVDADLRADDGRRWQARRVLARQAPE